LAGRPDRLPWLLGSYKKGRPQGPAEAPRAVIVIVER
jgi:hypothetical protein